MTAIFRPPNFVEQHYLFIKTNKSIYFMKTDNKFTTILLVMLTALCVFFVACSDDDPAPDPVPETVKVTGVTLNKSETNLVVGGSETLTATVAPTNAKNKSVTWSSSDEATVTVDSSGKITGVKAGTATITVKTADGGKTATCKVTVSTVAVAVTGVTLNKKETTISVGGEETLIPTITPKEATNQNVTWSSSDASVATVDDAGKITGVKAGTATITVKTADGEKTATCVVTVSVAEVAVTGVTLDKTVLSLSIDASETLKATIAPENATNKKLTWKSSNTAIATVDAEGKVTALKAGTATITVTTEEGGKTATCDVTVIAAVITGVKINGVTWATSNVDNPGTFAANPEDYGMFYQWNRIKGWPVTGDAAGWDSSSASGDSWEAANDPCPPGWRMPSLDEIKSLFDATVNNEWAIRNGVNGREFTDETSGNAIFLPAAGVRENNVGGLIIVGSEGHYWSSDNAGEQSGAYLKFTQIGGKWNGSTYRSRGLSIRCVNAPELFSIITSHPVDASVMTNETATFSVTATGAKSYQWQYSRNKGATWSDVRVTADNGAKTATYSFSAPDHSFDGMLLRCKVTNDAGVEYLSNTATFYTAKKGIVINGITWAPYNVDKPGTFANTPKNKGMLYQWNRRIGWSYYDTMVSSPSNQKWNSTGEPSTNWTAANDPCPDGWRMPTLDEIEKLLDGNKVRNDKIRDGDNTYYRFMDRTTSEYIFLPYVGARKGEDGSLFDAGDMGYYWTSTPREGSAAWGWTLEVERISGISTRYSYETSRAHSIRCVKK
ncbi:Ig-like domain-containing protein [Parabacteroides sp. OttesenSCG-928-G07]|nr:Ig-like domain-containing protein [Parabacteroides sp. OttesenSCG-928-G07]